jgi:hypothetical protein
MLHLWTRTGVSGFHPAFDDFVKISGADEAQHGFLTHPVGGRSFLS